MKIFGIGLSKTGTTSLAQGLEVLGFKTKDNPGVTRYSAGDLASIDADLLEEHDALTDTPIPSFYRQLDEAFPDAKFILTVRERDGWLKSCKKQFTERLAEKQNDALRSLFVDLYGCVVYDEERFSNGYDRFVAGVQAYFEGRPGKLLIMDVVGGDGWEKLCPFLGKAIPDIPFPKANVTQIRWMKIDDVVAIAREAGAPVARLHRAVTVGGPHSAEAAADRFKARLDSIYLRARGGLEFARERATRQACDIVVRRLSELNKGIPIVTRGAPPPPYAERCRWNHFWLVDPLDGEEGFGKERGGISINIALIEDQRPIYGVVYDPVLGTLYFGVPGKGTFKATDGGAPRAMDDRTIGGLAPAEERPSSRALRLCQLVEGVGGGATHVRDVMEWHSAAPHAIAASVGRSLCANERGEGLKFNTPELAQECVVVIDS